MQWKVEELQNAFSDLISRHIHVLLSTASKIHWRTNIDALVGMRIALFRKNSSPMPSVTMGYGMMPCHAYYMNCYSCYSCCCVLFPASVVCIVSNGSLTSVFHTVMSFKGQSLLPTPTSEWHSNLLQQVPLEAKVRHNLAIPQRRLQIHIVIRSLPQQPLELQ